MSLFDGQSVLLSVPGREAAPGAWQGSFAPPEALLAATRSPALRRALRLVIDHAHGRGAPLLAVARPEMFCHGLALDWFRDQTKGFDRHLCLSDGSAVKTIPGLETHVFFYDLQRQKSLDGLMLLTKLLPDLMASLCGQINTGFEFQSGARRIRPPPILLDNRQAAGTTAAAQFLPFFYSHYAALDMTYRLQEGPLLAEIDLSGAGRPLAYAPLSETALCDRGFARWVADMVLRTSLDRTARLVLRLPEAETDDEPLASRVAPLHAALQATGVVLPRSRLANVLLATEDLSETFFVEQRVPVHMYVHSSFDFWRSSSTFYRGLAQVTVVAGGHAPDLDFLPAEPGAVYGPQSELRRLP